MYTLIPAQAVARLREGINKYRAANPKGISQKRINEIALLEIEINNTTRLTSSYLTAIEEKKNSITGKNSTLRDNMTVAIADVKANLISYFQIGITTLTKEIEEIQKEQALLESAKQYAELLAKLVMGSLDNKQEKEIDVEFQLIKKDEEIDSEFEVIDKEKNVKEKEIGEAEVITSGYAELEQLFLLLQIQKEYLEKMSADLQLEGYILKKLIEHLEKIQDKKITLEECQRQLAEIRLQSMVEYKTKKRHEQMDEQVAEIAAIALEKTFNALTEQIREQERLRSKRLEEEKIAKQIELEQKEQELKKMEEEAARLRKENKQAERLVKDKEAEKQRALKIREEELKKATTKVNKLEATKEQLEHRIEHLASAMTLAGLVAPSKKNKKQLQPNPNQHVGSSVKTTTQLTKK